MNKMKVSKMKKKQKQALPKYRMSDMLKVAIEDARALYAGRDEDPAYYPVYYSYHKPIGGQCKICLAGVVLARTLHSNPEKYYSPLSYPGDENKLFAIDYMRQGRFFTAYGHFYKITPESGEELTNAYHDIKAASIAFKSFLGWEEFMLHINSLATVIPELARIEDKFGLVAHAKKQEKADKELEKLEKVKRANYEKQKKLESGKGRQ